MGRRANRAATSIRNVRARRIPSAAPHFEAPSWVIHGSGGGESSSPRVSGPRFVHLGSERCHIYPFPIAPRVTLRTFGPRFPANSPTFVRCTHDLRSQRFRRVDPEVSPATKTPSSRARPTPTVFPRVTTRFQRATQPKRSGSTERTRCGSRKATASRSSGSTKRRMHILNTKDKTVSTVDLPFDYKKYIPEDSPMAGREMPAQEVAVKATEESKKIKDWSARKYTVTRGGMAPGGAPGGPAGGAAGGGGGNAGGGAAGGGGGTWRRRRPWWIWWVRRPEHGGSVGFERRRGRCGDIPRGDVADKVCVRARMQPTPR